MEPIFTRYLYEKREAMNALLASLLKKKMRESLFWLYEVYLSGFEQEMWDWVKNIYESWFKNMNPRYERHVLSKYAEWTDTRNPELIGSVVMTLSHRSSRVTEPGTEPVPEKYVFLFNFISDYATKYPVKLADVSKFAIPKITCFTDEIREAYLSPDWLYYCRETPLWSSRIKEHGGTILDKRITFPTDELTEHFYDTYGLEPDEQSREIHEKHGIHLE